MNKFQLLFHRIAIITVLLVLQFSVLYIVFLRFNSYFAILSTVSSIASLIIVFIVLTGKSNPVYKLAWIIPIFMFPIFGILFYLLFGRNNANKTEKRKMDKMLKNMEYAQSQFKNDTLEEIKAEDLTAYAQSKYINDYAYCPPSKNTEVKYFSLGEHYFEDLKSQLSNAKHFIFMEYFIIEEGIMWNEILEILKEKAKEGVDVRVIYDDVGCLMTLPTKYYKTLETYGIRANVFTPVIPLLSAKLNNRDHRKITVIDGYVAFTGGVNIADEYINVKQKHGHWKDTGVMLKGEGVWNFTLMFLTLWEAQTGEKTCYENFRPEKYTKEIYKSCGYVQPYSSSPLDKEIMGENIYLNLINKAKRYVYITTPYLMIDNEMIAALNLAAKSGIDVRIVTPFIPDKWYVHAMTRAFYESLLDSGVKIYEYTPGFIHAKSFLVDDVYATIGTVNLDYRSLYLHFECGVWLYKSNAIKELRDDFEYLFGVCKKIELKELLAHSKAWRLLQKILVIFSPMM